MSIVTNKIGFELLECITLMESEINDYHPLAGSYAVVRCNDKFLICFNKWREQWEVPAGGRDDGETPKECAIRELFEETSQRVTELEFKGLIKVRKLNGTIKYNPVYYTVIDDVSPFMENEETERILLWDLKEDVGYIDEVDKHVLEWCSLGFS